MAALDPKKEIAAFTTALYQGIKPFFDRGEATGALFGDGDAMAREATRRVIQLYRGDLLTPIVNRQMPLLPGKPTARAGLPEGIMITPEIEVNDLNKSVERIAYAFFQKGQDEGILEKNGNHRAQRAGDIAARVYTERLIPLPTKPEQIRAPRPSAERGAVVA